MGRRRGWEAQHFYCTAHDAFPFRLAMFRQRLARVVARAAGGLASISKSFLSRPLKVSLPRLPTPPDRLHRFIASSLHRRSHPHSYGSDDACGWSLNPPYRWPTRPKTKKISTTHLPEDRLRILPNAHCRPFPAGNRCSAGFRQKRHPCTRKHPLRSAHGHPERKARSPWWTAVSAPSTHSGTCRGLALTRSCGSTAPTRWTSAKA